MARVASAPFMGKATDFPPGSRDRPTDHESPGLTPLLRRGVAAAQRRSATCPRSHSKSTRTARTWAPRGLRVTPGLGPDLPEAPQAGSACVPRRPESTSAGTSPRGSGRGGPEPLGAFSANRHLLSANWVREAGWGVHNDFRSDSRWNWPRPPAGSACPCGGPPPGSAAGGVASRPWSPP